MSKVIKSLVIVIDQNANECLYVDGVRWSVKSEDTANACALAEAAAGDPVIIEHRGIEERDFDLWPDTLDEVLRNQPGGGQAMTLYERMKELEAENQRLRGMCDAAAGDETDGVPVGWKIVAIWDGGSVLCESPAGNRCRYWFPGKVSMKEAENPADDAEPTTETRPIAEAFPVGEYVQDELDARGWSYAQAVECLSGDPRVNEAWLRLLCCVPAWHKHDIQFTTEEAGHLQEVFGIAATTWLDLDSQFQSWKRSQQLEAENPADDAEPVTEECDVPQVEDKRTYHDAE